MRRFSRSEMEAFLRQVDAALSTPCEIIVIGGAVVALKFKGTHATADIDLFKTGAREFWRAVEQVRTAGGPDIPVQKAAVAQAPYDFEDRLQPLALKGFTKLHVLVPEAHDLAIMKLARGEAHDLDAIEDIHRSSPLQLDTLIQRFRDTLLIGSPGMHLLSFLAAVERLFGERKATEVEALLKSKAR